ncbi:MAG: TonB-dependent receptor [Prevotellaceae bacterium]|jgi:TonB-linked SusC/RagA family outer membrane protein|nr:TonB-dependent receptor [Prevotellaceae bacterium]
MKRQLERKISVDIKFIIKTGFLCLFAGLMSLQVYAQGIRVTGSIVDNSGELLTGINVSIRGTTQGTMTDDKGEYSLTVPSDTTVLIFSSVGYVKQEIKVGSSRVISVILKEEAEDLGEVTVVAFAKQKKESVVASVTTIDTKELKVPSSNLTTAFAGRIAGLISYQRSGEPGKDNAEFFIRGVTTFGTGKANPLILIDGVEMTTEDLSRLTTDDIGSFSIMKDANATALYGARGANGVILVTTKEGREGKAKVSLRIESSYSAPTETMKYADPVTYMRLHNEAVQTRTPMALLPYTSSKIYYTEQGDNPLYYPAIDWQEVLFNDHTFNQRYNMSVNGGGAIARYYISAAYSKDNGIIKMDKRQNFNNNISINRYILRSNVNVNITKTTEAIVRLHGAFDDYSGPLDGGTDLYNKAMNANPVNFQPYYPADDAHRYANYILFGSGINGNDLNPYAEMLKGYKTTDRSNMMAQFEVKQDLKFITEGLSARAMFNVDRYANISMSKSYKPFFFYLAPLTGMNDQYILNPLNPDSGTDYLVAEPSGREITSTMYFEAALQYNRKFEKHSVSGLVVYTLREYLNGNAVNLEESLPYRNLGLAGRLTYSYDSRYFIEGNFGYNGSERFAKSERFGFFPSVGAGWIVTNEKFMKPFEKTLTKLKLKATYGLVGNDAIGDGRFFYLADVNMNDGNRGYTLGTEFGYHGTSSDGTGISIRRYSDPLITWEISRKTNLGVELNFWNELEIQVDYFRENRSKILQERSFIPTLMGLQGEAPSSNVGKANGAGVDISVDYSKTFNKDIWAVLRGNFTYASSKYEVFEEPDYLDTPWRQHKGQKISQTFGYVAERLFLDENEVQSSPLQFGEYGAGDIKYKDINGDMKIDENDQVPIGFPTTPEIIYGFGISAGYKNIDFSAFFQGSARSSFWIDPEATAPFVGNGTTNRAMLQYWADDHWTEDSKNIRAIWPRLSEYDIPNNSLNTDGKHYSTWFMRDGSFLRLKTMEIGYTLPKAWVERVKLQNARFYVSGSNLLVFSKFKMWDPEMAGNGLAYPLQRVFNLGLNIDF